MTAEEIKELREKLGLGREKFARLLGVSSNSVQNWEKGTYSPSDLAMEKLNNLAHKENK